MDPPAIFRIFKRLAGSRKRQLCLDLGCIRLEQLLELPLGGYQVHLRQADLRGHRLLLKAGQNFALGHQPADFHLHPLHHSACFETQHRRLIGSHRTRRAHGGRQRTSAGDLGLQVGTRSGIGV